MRSRYVIAYEGDIFCSGEVSRQRLWMSMCGIVGYVGTEQAGPILLEGLKRLEYRGYDSAGISVLSGDGLVTLKRSGKITRLETLVNERMPEGTCGIGHTRWATHGVPNEINAHPHLSGTGDIALVHNGIIENGRTLRRQLEERGYQFRSETDTEVVVHLVDHAFNQGAEALEEAVASALRQIDGTYGIAVISSRDPHKIVVARNGSPLLLGIGKNGECLVGSDVSAVLARTRDVVYLDDGDYAVLDGHGYRTFELARGAVRRTVHEVTWELDAIEKGGFDHFMLKEIFEQPSSLRDVMRGRLLEEEGNAKLGGITLADRDLLKIERIIITACGTSWHAGLIGEYMLEELARIPVDVEYASEFRYRNPVIEDGTLLLAISQSGETADTLAALREAKQRGSGHHGHRERGGIDHRARDRLRGLFACRSGDRRGLYEGVHEPDRGARALHPLPRSSPKHVHRRRAGGGARPSRAAGNRSSTSSSSTRSRVLSPRSTSTAATSSTWGEGTSFPWRSRARSSSRK